MHAYLIQRDLISIVRISIGSADEYFQPKSKYFTDVNIARLSVMPTQWRRSVSIPMNSLEKAQLSDMFSISHSSPNFLYIRKINPNIVAFINIYKEWVMNLNKTCLIATLLASFSLAGCQANADNYAADVYEPGQLNSKQETKTVDIISVLPAKVAVDNRENKQAAQTIGVILGALAGGVAGHNVGSGSGLATTAGAVGGGALGAAAGSLVKDKTLVEGISLTYREGTKVYTSTQVGKECQFTTGLAVVISTRNDETRIQPNTKCPDKK